MASEYLYNVLIGYVNQSAGVASGDTSIQLAVAPSFPTVCPYRIAIDTELMLVTVNVANLLTVTRGVEGTTATAHVNGAPVTLTTTTQALYNVFMAD